MWAKTAIPSLRWERPEEASKRQMKMVTIKYILEPSYGTETGNELNKEISKTEREASQTVHEENKREEAFVGWEFLLYELL